MTVPAPAPKKFAKILPYAPAPYAPASYASPSYAPPSYSSASNGGYRAAADDEPVPQQNPHLGQQNPEVGEQQQALLDVDAPKTAPDSDAKDTKTLEQTQPSTQTETQTNVQQQAPVNISTLTQYHIQK